MSYKVEDLEPGDVILVAGKKCFNRVVSWATINPFNHAAIVGYGCLIEALWKVQKSSLDTYKDIGFCFKARGVSSDQKDGAIKFAESKIGQGYGIKALMEDGARDILHIPLMAKLNPLGFVCSGMIVLGYKKNGFTITYAILPSPADLSYSPALDGIRPWNPF